MTNDGTEASARQVGNCRTQESRWGLVLTKEHKDSPRRIDRAVAKVLARAAIFGTAAKSVNRAVQVF
jgi:hypothetical protein